MKETRRKLRRKERGEAEKERTRTGKETKEDRKEMIEIKEAEGTKNKW